MTTMTTVNTQARRPLLEPDKNADQGQDLQVQTFHPRQGHPPNHRKHPPSAKPDRRNPRQLSM